MNNYDYTAGFQEKNTQDVVQAVITRQSGADLLFKRIKQPALKFESHQLQ